MALQYSATLRNAQLDEIETVAGTAPILRIYDGSIPANVAAAITGTLLAEMTLPTDWMAAASSGAKAMAGAWSDPSANAAGTASHFRLWKSDGTTGVMQGTCGIGTGDLQLNNTNIAVGQLVEVTAFTITAGNA
jgi:hypothetical protein